jgi:serine/threonine protein kinase
LPLSIGSRLGPYEILSALGAGGMGEVFRARDTKLGRDVALKVLPGRFLADPNRVARFQREATTLAALNHPNIGGIHGLEDMSGVTALVLELVEGPTLADRIERGPIPLDEALPIARQIVEAIESAHRQGIVHRDLKPANIKVRPDGMVKVLDFGLAKAIEPAVAAASLSDAATLTTPAMTEAGVIIGTAAYMSPEQARGKAADERADVWAFGCVLFEMLTGRRAFEGAGVSETLARVLERDPQWEQLPATLPSSLQTYLKRSLQKDPRQRVQSMGDVRLALDGAFEAAVPSPVAVKRTGAPMRLALVAAVVTIGVLTAALAWIALRTATPRVARLQIAPSGPAVLTSAGTTATSPSRRAAHTSCMSATGARRSSFGRSMRWRRRWRTPARRAAYSCPPTASGLDSQKASAC